MEEFFAHFQEYLILGLLAALFFKESLEAYIRGLLGMDKKEKVPAWGLRLTEYANHNTTEALNKLITMEEKEHAEADSMRELVKEGNAYLREFKEYGIRIRTK